LKFAKIIQLWKDKRVYIAKL